MPDQTENEFRDIAVVPNTRAIDVLNQLKLRGFQLAKPEGGMFAHTDNIYDSLSDGQNVTERSNAATEERLKSGHAVGGLSIV